MNKKKHGYEKRLSVRLDTNDYYHFKKQAESAGLHMSDYLRVLIRHPNRSANATMSLAKSNNKIAENLDKIANGQLAYIGSNINQIARKINQGNYPSNLITSLNTAKNTVNQVENKIFRAKEKRDEQI